LLCIPPIFLFYRKLGLLRLKENNRSLRLSTYLHLASSLEVSRTVTLLHSTPSPCGQKTSLLRNCLKHKNYSTDLTLILLTWIIWWAPNNANKWQMGFNLAFKGLNSLEILSNRRNCFLIIILKLGWFEIKFKELIFEINYFITNFFFLCMYPLIQNIRDNMYVCTKVMFSLRPSLTTYGKVEIQSLHS
jgi:hypothetical protein